METALICPMECPKGLRNGSCGGSTSEYCYVDKTRPCVCYKIYERSFRYGREERLLEVLPPLDWDKVGHDSWRNIFRNISKLGWKFFLGAAASPFSSNPKFQALREQKNVHAGAQFFQTNLVYDVDGMEVRLNELARRNVLGKVYILIGVTPLKSLKMAQMLSKVLGVYLPKAILERMEAADQVGNAREEGFQIALGSFAISSSIVTRASTAFT